MPIPIILGGIAAGTALAGLIKGAQAISDSSDADDLNERAKDIFDNAQKDLEREKKVTTNALESLGELKLYTYSNQLGRFVNLVKRVKNVRIEGNAATDELLQEQISREKLSEIEDMSLKASEVLGGGVSALGAGALAGVASYGGAMMFASASTGTAISALSGAAATNATLAWFGGGSLAAGGGGMALGTLVLGGVVTGPILMIGGWMLSEKAKEKLANARSNHAEARKAAEQMKNVMSVLIGIKEISEQFSDVLTRLNGYFDKSLDRFENILTFISKMTGKHEIEYDDLNENQKQYLYQLYLFAKTAKTLSDTPILKKDGSPDDSCLNQLEPAQKMLASADV